MLTDTCLSSCVKNNIIRLLCEYCNKMKLDGTQQKINNFCSMLHTNMRLLRTEISFVQL
jgi:DNA polymerase III delta subunit